MHPTALHEDKTKTKRQVMSKNPRPARAKGGISQDRSGLGHRERGCGGRLHRPAADDAHVRVARPARWCDVRHVRPVAIRVDILCARETLFVSHSVRRGERDERGGTHGGEVCISVEARRLARRGERDEQLLWGERGGGRRRAGDARNKYGGRRTTVELKTVGVVHRQAGRTAAMPGARRSSAAQVARSAFVRRLPWQPAVVK